MLLLHTLAAVFSICPGGTTNVDKFTAENASWLACEDVGTPGGDATPLISADT